MAQAGSSVRAEEVPEWRRRLHWSASGHGWFATAKDGTRVCVSEETYERCLCAYLESVGIERKVWTQIIAPTEDAWRGQCAVADRFRADLDSWLTSANPGVKVWRQPMCKQSALRVGPLRWSASGHGWFGATDEVAIFVPEAVYEQRLKEYLAAQGITWKTLMQMMQPAEEAWQRQCEAEHRLQSNLEFWLTSDCPGVQIVRHDRCQETR